VEQEDTQFDIHKYIKLLLKRKWLLIVPTIVIGVISIIYASLKPNIYESKCVLLVENASALEQLVAGKRGQRENAGSVISIVRQRMLSWQSVIQHIRFLGLDKGFDIDDSVGLQRLYAKITKNTHLRTSGRDLINVSYRGEDPEMNFRILDGLVTNFFEASLKESRAEVGETLGFINEDLKRLKRNLNESEQTLIRFEEEQMEDLQFVVGKEGSGGKQFKLSLVKGELEEIDKKINEINDKITFLGDRKNNVGETRIEEVTKVPNPKIDDLNKKISELDIALSTMRSKYYDEHPKIQETLKTLASLKEMLKGEPLEIVSEQKISSNPMFDGIAQQLFDAQLELKSLQRTRKETDEKLVSLKESIKDIPALRQEAFRLKRDYEINKNLYESRIAQKAKAELAKELSLEASVNPFRIVEPARIAYKPLKSVKIKIVGMGFIMGMGLGVGLIFGLEKIDNRFKALEEVQNYLDLPALGMIPTILTYTEIKRKFRQKIVISASVTVFIIVTTLTCFFVEPVRTKVNIGWDKLIELAKNN
jgi:polysaccharide chain length determinant protein (PEP-CTERM system associated)